MEEERSNNSARTSGSSCATGSSVKESPESRANKKPRNDQEE